jgi:hypothetical protein
MAFAGQDDGIYSGVYDAVLPGEIQWATTPELNISRFPEMVGGHPERVMSMAEANGELFATVGQKIYRRNDGHPSSWTEVWNNPIPGKSQSGLRGMTNVNGNLWVAVEGTRSRIVRVDPTTYNATQELDISGQHQHYLIAAYNNMCLTELNGSPMLLIGIDGGPDRPAHYLSLYQGVWRKCTIPSLAPKPMRACRTICIYNGEVYYGGYDCYQNREDDTAWIVKSTIADALNGG